MPVRNAWTIVEHNRLLVQGYKRADELEPKLVDVLVPIFEKVGRDAATAFAQRATDHLTAADTGADITSRSAMVAVFPRPDEAKTIAEPGGEPAELIHVTLCYLGEIDEDTEAKVSSALTLVAGSHPPLWGVVGGVGMFGSPSIALPNVRGLAELRQAVCEAVVATDTAYPRDHGYLPHARIAYRENGSEAPPDRGLIGSPLHFDSVKLVVGNEVVADYPLTGHPSLTADASSGSNWSAPAPNEVINVAALVSTLRTKTDPVRVAVVEAQMTPALEAAGISFDVTNPLTAKVLAQSGSQVVNIAQTTQLNVMRTIKASYEEGLSIPDTAKAIQVGMKEAAFTRATLIARTEIVGAVNGGSLAATKIVSAAEGGVELFKEWLTAPGAMYPRHEDYEDLDGQTVHMDDTFDVGGEQLEYPGDPSGDPAEVCNCRCVAPWTEVSGPTLAGMRRWFDGHLVRLTTARGRELSVSPNHPVLTLSGWVQAGLLKEGDDLLCCHNGDGITGGPDVEDVPSEAVQLFAALELAASRTERVPAGLVNLHGECIKGEIEVVRASDRLSMEPVSEYEQHLLELSLALAHREVGLSGDTAAFGFVPESKSVRSATVANLDSGTQQKLYNGLATDVETLAQGEGALTRRVGSDDLGCDGGVSMIERDAVRVAVCTTNASLSESLPNEHGREADLACDLLVRFAGLVESDPLVDVVWLPFLGHVYNFSSRTGAYTAAGILVANCTMVYTDDASQLTNGDGGAGVDSGETIGEPVAEEPPPLDEGYAEPSEPAVPEWTKEEIEAPRAFVKPPPPKAGSAHKPGGYSSDKAFGTNTKIGDWAEDHFSGFTGGKKLVRTAEQTARQSPFDVRVDGYLFEVKACSTESTKYAATPKKAEIINKSDAAKAAGLEPAIVVPVLDRDSGMIHYYWRPGVQGGRVSEATGWRYMGSQEVHDWPTEAVEAHPVMMGQATTSPPTIFQEGRLEKIPVWDVQDRALSLAGSEISPEAETEYRDAFAKLQDEVDNTQWPSGAADEAYSAIERVGLETVQVLRSETGEMLGVVDYNAGLSIADRQYAERLLTQTSERLARNAYEDDYDREVDKEIEKALRGMLEKPDEIGVNHLASSGKEPGIGARLMQEVAKAARDKGTGVGLNSLSEATGFYERLGMTASDPERPHDYHWTPEQAKRFAETGSAEPPVPLPTPTPPSTPVAELRPHSHLTDLSLNSEIGRTRGIVKKLLAKDSLSTTEQARYQHNSERLAGLLRERDLRRAAPERPFANHSANTLQTYLYNARKEVRELEAMTHMNADQQLKLAAARDRIRQLVKEREFRKTATLPPPSKPAVPTPAPPPPPTPTTVIERPTPEPPAPPASERMERLRQVYASRPSNASLSADRPAAFTNDQKLEWEQKITSAGADFAAEVEERMAAASQETFLGHTQSPHYLTKRREVITQVLSEVRPVGPGPGWKMTVASGSDKGAQALVEQAVKLYPRDWIQKIGGKRIRFLKTERGYFSDGKGEIAIGDRQGANRTDPSGFVTAVHEFGHAMESVMPDIRVAEQRFYMRRTSTTGSPNDSLEKPKRYRGGRKTEFVRPDEFINEYIGKDYRVTDEHDNYPPSGGQYFEILSVGMEELMTGYRMWVNDPDMANFILGLLVSI